MIPHHLNCWVKAQIKIKVKQIQRIQKQQNQLTINFKEYLNS
jgi:hypothetical protein